MKFFWTIRDWGNDFALFFLRPYRRRGALAFQKARIQLMLLFFCVVLTNIYWIHALYLYGRVERSLLITVLGGLFLLLLLIVLLRAGYYLVSGHGFLLQVSGVIWLWMFFGAAPQLSRLDTIAVLLSLLVMAPLLTDRRGLLVHYGLNAIVLVLFHFLNPAADEMSIYSRQAYAMDTIIALIFSGYVCYYLIKTSNRAQRDIARSNKKLARSVAARTRALTRVQNKLEASRDELQRDMEMARNVQGNLLADRVPPVSDWSLAFVFRPLAPVSGDFYDFYAEDERLAGLGLFDVSGHGVASGLITVLAKAIIHRKFKGLGDRPLSAVLESANEELTHEMRHAGNFLTGVLLRCGDGFVETVNAGHADVLLCDSSGAIRPLARSDRSHRGTFLGLEFLAGPYPVLRTELRSGDALLVYSDGLTECLDEREEPFGQDRLREVFQATAGMPDAQERLDRIVNTVHLFLDGRSFTDDMTAVLLVKK